jgi:menaquinone-dependent protoporphyrinogen oxidase
MSRRSSRSPRPGTNRVFAGKIDKKNLSFPERAMLVVFRGLERDFRDWAEIKEWASGIADALGS